MNSKDDSRYLISELINSLCTDDDFYFEKMKPDLDTIVLDTSNYLKNQIINLQKMIQELKRTCEDNDLAPSFLEIFEEELEVIKRNIEDAHKGYLSKKNLDISNEFMEYLFIMTSHIREFKTFTKEINSIRKKIFTAYNGPLR